MTEFIVGAILGIVAGYYFNIPIGNFVVWIKSFVPTKKV